MVRQDKTRSGRVTPKGTKPETVASGGMSGPSGVSREPVKVGGGLMSSAIPFIMFGLMGLGVVVIVLNYVITGFGTPSNWYLLGGLGLILGGIIAATQYR